MKRIPITQFTDAAVARSLAKRMAKDAGFEGPHQTEIAIAVSELATNIVKYGVSGEIWLEFEPDIFIITAKDHGPGFKDLELAFQDNCTDCEVLKEESLIAHDGHGTGLPAVKRLMDQCDVIFNTSEGTLIKAVKYRYSAENA